MINEEFELNTPVLIVFFNRPDTLEKVFEKVREAKPKELFLVADGPRDDHPEDARLCEECRKLVSDDRIDWPCKVYRNYSEVNLGCGRRPASGFTWTFEHVDRVIILEDDCVPSKSFFRFCQEMLERYAEDPRIYSVSGMNWGYEDATWGDYFYSYHTNSNGWATWKRVWDLYEIDLKNKDIEDSYSVIKKLFPEKSFSDYWMQFFKESAEGKIDHAWDYQFTFLSFIHKGLNIWPTKNLIEYIGIDSSATHTTISETEMDQNRFFQTTRVAEEMTFPLQHPVEERENFWADYLGMRDIFKVSTDGRSVCHALPELIETEIGEYTDIILYGAGAVCKDVINLLDQIGISRFMIAVTQKPGEKKYVMGNPVYGIEELKDKADTAAVILAVTKRYQPTMIENLKKLGFKNYYCI